LFQFIEKNAHWRTIQTGAEIQLWISDQQHFDGVPSFAWDFYIGGYQPAQKWLKDHKGRDLTFEDILHYQKIILVLFETERQMQD